MKTVRISDRTIGNHHAPFIVAEMSGNHNQSLDQALAIVEAAAKAGAHALKLQTYTANTMTLPIDEGEFFISDEESLWKGESLYNLYAKAHTPWEWHAPIIQLTNELGLICFSTPFDESAVDFLEDLNVPAYKIASFEIVHLPLIRKVASTGKPIILSTGMATIAEINDAVSTAREAGCLDLVLLKCTSAYPANAENCNILTIPHMREIFDCEVGLSDHTMGIGASVAAIAHGATVIEKHFTLSREDGGIDSAFSLEPDELEALVIECQRAWQSLGKIAYGAHKEEAVSLTYRRSIYIAEDIMAGDLLTSENTRCIRPGLGLSPKHYDKVLGRRVTRNLKRGTPLSWKLIT